MQGRFSDGKRVLRVLIVLAVLLSTPALLAGCGGGGSGGGSPVATTPTGGGESDPTPSPSPSTAPTTNPWNSPGKANQPLVAIPQAFRDLLTRLESKDENVLNPFEIAVRWSLRALADSDQYEPVATSDGGDGAWCAWFDNRNGDALRDVFVGAFDANFAHRAGFESGVPAFVGLSGRRELPTVATFQDGSLLVAAQDSHYGPRAAISANRIVRDGNAPAYPLGQAGVRVSFVDYQNTAGITGADPLFDSSQFRAQTAPLAVVTADNVGVVAYQEGGSVPGIGVSFLTATGEVTVVRVRSGNCVLSALVAGDTGGAYVAWEEGGNGFAAFVSNSGAPVVWALGNGVFPRLAALPNGDMAFGMASDRDSAGTFLVYGGVYGPDGTIRWADKVSDTPCHPDQGVDVVDNPGNASTFVWEGSASEALYSRRVSSAGNPAAERTLTTLSSSRALPRAIGEGNNFHLLGTKPGSVLYNSYDPNGVGSHGENPLQFTTPAGQHKIRGFAIPGSPSGRFVAVFQEEVGGHSKVAGRMPSRQP